MQSPTWRVFLLLLLSAYVLSDTFPSNQASQMTGAMPNPTVTPGVKTLLEPTPSCPALKNFITPDKNISESFEENRSNYCPMLQKSCCTVSDFESLRDWWERPVSYTNLENSNIKHQTKPLSRFQVRAVKQYDIGSFTWEMLNLVEELKKRARLVLMSDKGDSRCMNAADRFIEFKFLEENYRDYLKKAQTCWRFTNDVQTKILCDACDPNAQKNFDLQGRKILLNSSGKASFEASCMDMIHVNLTYVFPYLENLEPLVRCNLDGKMSTKDRLRLRKSDRIWDDLDDGLTEDMLTHSLTFGEELNLNSEGDARFVTF